jgi:hypothetical protein
MLALSEGNYSITNAPFEVNQILRFQTDPLQYPLEQEGIRDPSRHWMASQIGEIIVEMPYRV